jgi:glycosyltransferase involved in cell wall biosynthesis
MGVPLDRSTDVSVVVPLYRTAGQLAELHRRVAGTLEALTWELVLVSDACPEGSGDAARDLRSEDRRVVPIEHAARRGQHAAFLTGLRHANGRAVVLLDGDLEDPPEAMPRLLAALERGHDAVYAGRGASSAQRRPLASRAFKSAVGRLAGMPSDAGTYVALEREVVDALLALPNASASLPAMTGSLARRPAVVPVDREARPAGRSSYTVATRVRLGVRTLHWLIVQRLRGRVRASCER